VSRFVQPTTALDWTLPLTMDVPILRHPRLLAVSAPCKSNTSPRTAIQRQREAIESVRWYLTAARMDPRLTASSVVTVSLGCSTVAPSPSPAASVDSMRTMSSDSVAASSSFGGVSMMGSAFDGPAVGLWSSWSMTAVASPTVVDVNGSHDRLLRTICMLSPDASMMSRA
jgi:hypothetical protein